MLIRRLLGLLPLCALVSCASFDVSNGVSEQAIDASLPPDASPTPDALAVDASPPATDAALGIDAPSGSDGGANDGGPGGPVVIGYWRMEDEEQGSPDLSIANEVPGGPSLVSERGELFKEIPVDHIPLTGQANLGSLGAPGGGDDIDGLIAYDPVFEVTSITIEFWARVEESNAFLLIHGTDGVGDDLRISQPNDLRFNYRVDDQDGDIVVESLNTSHNMNGQWHHYAFTYDEVEGRACFYLDGLLEACRNGPDGRPLAMYPNAVFHIGRSLSGNGINDGVIDELRIWNGAVDSSKFLTHQP